MSDGISPRVRLEDPLGGGQDSYGEKSRSKIAFSRIANGGKTGEDVDLCKNWQQNMNFYEYPLIF